MRFLAWLAAMRSSQVDSLASPRKVSMLLKTVTNTSWAMSSASARSPTMRSTRLNTRSPYSATSSWKARSSRARRRARNSRSPRLIGGEGAREAGTRRASETCTWTQTTRPGAKFRRLTASERTAGPASPTKRLLARPPDRSMPAPHVEGPHLREHRRRPALPKLRSPVPPRPPPARTAKRGGDGVLGAARRRSASCRWRRPRRSKSSRPSTASTSGSVGVTATPPPRASGAWASSRSRRPVADQRRCDDELGPAGPSARRRR